MKDYFSVVHDDKGIAWLHLDQPDSAANVLTQEALEEFDHQLITIAQMHPKALVIRSDKTSGFIAGADVKAFAKISDKHAAEDFIRRVHQIFNRLESFSFPTIALIHGFCLGGGLELALACQYRIARNDPKTKLGFPEVRLGIFPGFGGTVRSIRKLGHLKAMELMLSGRLISAKAARRIGLVDYAVPERQMDNAVHQLLESPPRPIKLPLLQSVAGLSILRPLIAMQLRKQVAKHANPKHYPAPYELIEHWVKHARSEQALYDSEARKVSELMVTDNTQNMIRVFLLQDRLKSLADKNSAKVTHVHVVGGGIMGGDIAAWCVLKGLQVTLQDRAPEFLGNAIKRAHLLFKKKLKDAYLIQSAKDRLTADYQGYGVSGADVVIEAIFEDIEAKQTLYSELEPRMQPDAILATNTSSIPLDILAKKLNDPARLVGLHFFNPVAKMPLVEIVSTPDTDKSVKAKATAFAKQIGKLPLPVKSSPGFLVNRVLMPYLLEAVKLHEEGVPGELIDKAATDFGMPMGPIELADTVGLDICLSVAQKMSDVLHNEVPASLSRLVDQNKLGRKSGAGFYPWKNGKVIKNKSATQTKKSGELIDRLILRLINEAVACLREGIVEDENLIDAGIIFGTGFAPFRGGPLYYAHTIGGQQLQARLEELERSHGDSFHADDGWAAVY